MHCDGGDNDKPEPKGPNAVNIIGRIAAMGLAVASAALMATARQCTIVLPNGAVTHTVTYSDFGPFVYLVVANAMAAPMLAVAIFLSVWKKGGGKCSGVLVLLQLLDAATPALLYSATGAAFAAGEYMSYCEARGRQVSVCAASISTSTSNFCSQVHMAIYISLAAAAAVSAAEMVKNVTLSLGGSGSCSEDGCGHGCHHKH